MKRALVILLAFAVAVSLLGASLAFAKADLPSVVVDGNRYYAGDEIIEWRQENSKSFVMPNGNIGLDISIGAIHFKYDYNNPYEQWRDIDLTWVGNRITKAPYVLTLEGNKITVRDRKSGEVSTIELLEIGGQHIPTQVWECSRGLARAFDTDLEVVARNTKVSFTRILKSDTAPREAKYRVTGSIPLWVRAWDEEGELPVEWTLKDDILTENLKPDRPIKYPIRIDPTLDIDVAANADDCYRYSDTNTPAEYFSATSVVFRAGKAHATLGPKQGSAARFIVNISQGATITTAYLIVTARANKAGVVCNTKVSAEDADNVGDFSGDDVASFDARYANHTTAIVDWNAIGAWTTGNPYNSPEIKTVIQEMVDRGDWDSGDAMVIFWEDFGDDSDANTYRDGASIEGAENEPRLHIEYVALVPSVTTVAAINIEATTATLRGNVTDDQGETIDERGFEWDDDASGAPYAHSWTENGGGDYGEGAFSHGVAGLPTGKTIYFRAKAHSTNGWGYGGELTFLTKPAAPTNVAATSGDHNQKVTITWTKSTGATGYQVYRDGGALGWLGDVATYDDNAADAGTVTAGTASASDGAFEAHVELILTGEAINDGTIHTYKVRAKNATGESADSATDTGFRRPVNLTYQWYRSAGDADGGYGLLGGATSDPYDDVGAPADGSGRWYYCEVNATGAVAQNSTHDRGYRAVAPIVTTNGCTGFGKTWATLNGILVDDGLPANCTQVGFDYGLTNAYGSEWTRAGSWSDGDVFVGVLTGLSPASVYHWRAKAFNGVWGVGSDMMFSAEGSPTIYEYLSSGGDGNGADIYASNWAYMQFTTGATAHTVTHVNLYLQRTGNPSTVTASIRYADGANKPTGEDLCSATVDGDDFAVTHNWHQFVVDEISLEASQSYAIVVRALAGDNANDVQWRWDAGGSLANAVAGHTTDGGVTWTLDAPADFLFEVWGYPCIKVVGAAAFQDYLEDGDLLFVAEYINVYPPYYPSDIPARYFDVQLLDTDGVTIIASTVCREWENYPASIYLNADEATPLTIGSLYYIRLYGDFTGNPNVTYQLTAADWQGDNLDYLDQWVILTARSLEDYYGRSLVTTVGTKKKLNEEGGIIFTIGIPMLPEKRPDLFQVVIRTIDYVGEIWTDGYEGADTWQSLVGADIVTIFDDGGDLIGLDGKTFGALGLLFLYVIVALVVVGTGHTTAGLILAFPFLLMAFWLRLLDIVILAVVALVFAVLIVWSLWWSRT